MSILDEAKQIIVDREKRYGPARQHFAKTVALINAYFGTEFEPEDWPIIISLDKLARNSNMEVRDNSVDICGYLERRQDVLAAKQVNDDVSAPIEQCEAMHTGTRCDLGAFHAGQHENFRVNAVWGG